MLREDYIASERGIKQERRAKLGIGILMDEELHRSDENGASEHRRTIFTGGIYGEGDLL